MSSHFLVHRQTWQSTPALVPIGGPASGNPTARQGKIMGLKLSSGGHLTHGQSVSFTGKVWKQVPYEVDPKTELLNFTTLKKIAMEEKPDIIVAGFTAYPRIVDFKKFRAIADACGALLHIDMSHFAGLWQRESIQAHFHTLIRS